MPYVVYEVESTRMVPTKNRTYYFLAEGTAKAHKTRLVKKGTYTADQIEVADADVYKLLIEKQVEKTNLMSGKTYWESVNTPSYCSPASEAYWSA